MSASYPIILLAAGASSRMGGVDKLLQPVRGQTLLADRTAMCLASTTSRVICVLPPDRPERRRAVHGLGVEIAVTNGSQHGMAHSLQVGLQDIEAQAVMIMLADLPDLTVRDLDAVFKAAHDSKALIVRGASSGQKPGHPVILRKALFADVVALQGDVGAQPVLRRYADRTDLVALPGTHALRDLDTPEQWRIWYDKNKG